jgi:hypothetical protein
MQSTKRPATIHLSTLGVNFISGHKSLQQRSISQQETVAINQSTEGACKIISVSSSLQQAPRQQESATILLPTGSLDQTISV